MVTQVATDITGQPGLPGLSLLNFVGDADVTSAQTLADRVGAFYQALATEVTGGTVMTGTGTVTVRNDATGEVTASHTVTPTEAVGIKSGDRLPAGTQGVLHVRTGVYISGRESRGRIYIPAPGENSNDVGGTPSSDYMASIRAAAETHLIGGAEFPLGVWSPTHLRMTLASGVTASSNWARLSTRRT